jgi:hypothetical protein
LRLIDDSIMHLHGLMKRVAPTGEGDLKNPFRMIDPRQVHAAVGCAATVYKLMRLKLDVHKEITAEKKGGTNADRRA